jgi:protein-S-isoprenylcysteine O-methyltransferase Ste14
MRRPWLPILNTTLFTVIVPGTMAGYLPYRLLGGLPHPSNAPLTWLGGAAIVLGAAVYLRCAWEFAARGLGTPAPIAPTKFLVTTALHRYVRNPMYIGVLLIILGEAMLSRSLKLLEYAGLFFVVVHLFVVFYEEPTLRRKFGESYELYRRSVPRWIPRINRHGE